MFTKLTHWLFASKHKLTDDDKLVPLSRQQEEAHADAVVASRIEQFKQRQGEQK